MRDALGRRGESIFHTLMTRFHKDTGPRFKAQFLGDKWRTVDYIVELVEAGDEFVPFFFVQVKTTRAGYTHRDGRLRVAVSGGEMRRLAAYPAPTYVVGIDEARESGYLLSANGEHLTHLSSLTTDHPIDEDTRTRLWSEVLAYWRKHRATEFVSEFRDPEWR